MFKVILIIIVVYLILLLFFNWYEYQVIYHPVKRAISDYRDLQLEDVFMTDEQIGKIHGVYKEQNRDLVILYSHGNAGNITYNLGNLKFLDQTSYSYLMYDYPGYGKSEGSPSEENVYGSGQTAYDFLIKEKKYRPDQIILHGQSMGGAVSIELATKNPVRSVVVESSLTSTHDAARKLFSFFPAKLFITNKYVNIEKVKQLDVPILFIHGKQDNIFPYEFSEKLYAAANEPKYLILIPTIGHNELIPEPYLTQILEFIKTSQIQEK